MKVSAVGDLLLNRMHRLPRRRGVAMLIILVTLLIVTILMGMVIRQTLASHQYSRRRAQHTQAVWLVESGVERAVAALIADPEYQGEQWRIAASELSDSGAARVLIEVSASDEDEAQMLITVRATYPADAEQFATAHKQVSITKRSSNEREDTEDG